ncbi:hypothetical protein ACRAQ6_04375 [Erythrobacter sp. HA6-11]
MTATNPSAQSSIKRKPVLPWFGAFFAVLFGMIAVLSASDIDDPLIANGLILVSMIFLIKAGMNAVHNAGKQGAQGSPTRNYLIRMLVVSVAYVGSLFAASSLIEEGDPITILSLAIAVVPGLAVVGYFWAIGSFIVELKDEFIRMLNVRQSLIATAISMSAASIWGFLENFGQVPHVDAYWWPIVWFFGLGIGALANKIQFGTAGEC